MYFRRCRKESGWQRNVWRFLYRNHLEQLHWDVLEQDRIILGKPCAKCACTRILYQHDVGLASFTPFNEKEAEKQLKKIVALNALNRIEMQEEALWLM